MGTAAPHLYGFGGSVSCAWIHMIKMLALKANWLLHLAARCCSGPVQGRLRITTHLYCIKTDTAHLISREWRLQTACRNCFLPFLSIRSMFFAARFQHFPRITFIKPIKSVITHFKMPFLRSGLTIRRSEPMHLERTSPPPEPLLDDSIMGE